MGATLRDDRASFSRLDRTIRRWTSRLLVTAIVLALGLALGWQVSAWWSEKPPVHSAGEATSATDLPQLGPGREFLMTNGLLKVERQAGDASEAINAMKAFCRQAENKTRSKATGPGEAEFVAQLLAEPPLEDSPTVSLYQPPGQTAMIVAIHRDSRQIAAWSFAVPSDDGAWSLYHFRPK